MKNLEKVVLDYFKLINPLPYDEVKIDMMLKLRDVIFINIYTKDPLSYTPYPSSDNSTLKQIQKDMNDMFPYEIIVRVILGPKILVTI
jgi:hypothetical protein